MIDPNTLQVGNKYRLQDEWFWNAPKGHIYGRPAECTLVKKASNGWQWDVQCKGVVQGVSLDRILPFKPEFRKGDKVTLSFTSGYWEVDELRPTTKQECETFFPYRRFRNGDLTAEGYAYIVRKIADKDGYPVASKGRLITCGESSVSAMESEAKIKSDYDWAVQHAVEKANRLLNVLGLDKKINSPYIVESEDEEIFIKGWLASRVAYARNQNDDVRFWHCVYQDELPNQETLMIMLRNAGAKINDYESIWEFV